MPASRFELLAEGVEVELAFEVVHAGLQERFAVQRAPEADGAELLARRRAASWAKSSISSSGERSTSLKVMMPVVGLLHHLRAPARLRAPA